MNHLLTTVLWLLSLLQSMMGAPLGTDKLKGDSDILRIKQAMESFVLGKNGHLPKYVLSIILRANKGILNLYFGDIFRLSGRSTTSCASCLWPISSTNLVYVPYVISPDYSAKSRAMILKAMDEIMTLSCVRFVEHKTETDYVNITPGGGCWSVLGRSGGKQGMSLSSQDCMIHGVIQHELLHALGFTHEINRSDRDDYIRIFTENIKPEELLQFISEDTNNLGLPYDYHSVMHHDRFAYTSNGKETIVPILNTSVSIGQTDGVSPLDVIKLNTLYKCNLCRTLHDESKGTVTSTNYPSEYPSDSNCLYLIRVPGQQAFLSFQDFDIQTSENCMSAYLQIYDGPTKTSPLLLERACGNALPQSLLSSGNSMLLEFVSEGDVAAKGFKASYIQANCGAVFLENNGVITSPNYPLLYPDLLDCIYSITAPVGFKILLTFNLFKLELAAIDCVDAGDFLVVYDGNNLDAPVLGKFCSYAVIPPPQMSSGNSMVLYFKTNMWISYLGFEATYSFEPNN